MERYSLIVITDETAPIRRFDLSKARVHRALKVAVGVACLILLASVDYVRVRIDHSELDALRARNEAQRARIEQFSDKIAAVDAELSSLREFERKVRIIANLPGAAATGGEDVIAVGTAREGDLDAAAHGAPEIETGSVPEPPDGPATTDAASAERDAAPADDPDSVAPPTEEVSRLDRDAARLGAAAKARRQSMSDLLAKLEAKRRHLASTPAIWPAKGWLTSRFGNRISPFTGARQFHGGIDIAGQRGTEVIAPARGRVSYVGKKGALGRTLTIDHGYGVRTVYGHVDEILARRNQQVERGDVIAALGSTGRSTGPHLHYVVEVNGKAVDPLDYIFD
jgi:murein DD-endopeptidase MepM/ murein hydrolase activator NlpD